MTGQYGVSQRRACGLLELQRSTCRYLVRPRENGVLLEQLRMIPGDMVSERGRILPRKHKVLPTRLLKGQQL